MGRERSWVSASDLAEYAYCPRALYYRRRIPDAPEGPASFAGREFHRRTLSAEDRRAAHGGAYWAVLLLGLLLVLLGLWGGRLV